MSAREEAAERVQQYIWAFRCPHCHSAMEVADRRSLVCSRGHNFDFARQGYINLLTRPARSAYTRELFAARQGVILDTSLFAALHQRVSELLAAYLDGRGTGLVADLGCGEGSHLSRILHTLSHPELMGVGLDISREGILLAARRHPQYIWMVGDLARSPLQDHVVQVLLNILSPANYEEFRRILAPGGLLLKVVPGAGHLRQLRQLLFPRSAKVSYQNESSISLFERHLPIQERFRLSETHVLRGEELNHLVSMTPLTWNVDSQLLEKVRQRERLEVTIDLEILAGVMPESG